MIDMTNHTPAPDNGVQPRIYVKTLGAFEVSSLGQPVTFSGNGVGAHQLKRMLAYLIVYRDRQVRRDILSEVARATDQSARRCVPGLRAMFSNWRILEAFITSPSTVTLQRHPLWQTDTDRLEMYVVQAQHLRQLGQRLEALPLLQAAESLCGGVYLPVLDVIPEYVPYGEIAYWTTVQKHTLRSLACLYLRVPKPRVREQALRVVGRLIQIDHLDRRSYNLAAYVARTCDNESAARDFERRRDNLDLDA